MLTLRARIFGAVSIGVLLLLAVGLGILWYTRRAQPATTDQATTTSETNLGSPAGSGVGGVPGAITGLTVKQPTTEAMEKNAAKQLAKIFIERYGSYSTDSDYQNIREIQPIVTDKLWSVLSKRLSAPVTGAFVGVTTHAIAASLTSWKKDASAVVDMQITQTEIRDGAERQYQRTATVNLVKSGGLWLVDTFTLNK